MQLRKPRGPEEIVRSALDQVTQSILVVKYSQ